MTYQQLRNLLVLQLFQYLDGPRVVLSDQVMPESEYPYLYYQGIQLRIPGPFNVENQAGTEHVQIRREQAQATFSFTACSRTEDEALELAERAQSFFLWPGRKILAAHGVAVLEVQNVQSRSAFEIDDGTVLTCWCATSMWKAGTWRPWTRRLLLTIRRIPDAGYHCIYFVGYGIQGKRDAASPDPLL